MQSWTSVDDGLGVMDLYTESDTLPVFKKAAPLIRLT